MATKRFTIRTAQRTSTAIDSLPMLTPCTYIRTRTPQGVESIYRPAIIVSYLALWRTLLGNTQAHATLSICGMHEQRPAEKPVQIVAAVDARTRRRTIRAQTYNTCANVLVLVPALVRVWAFLRMR